MDTSKEGESDRQLQTNAIARRYYRLNTVIIVIGLIVIGFFAYNDGQQVKDSVNVIKTNQHTNSSAIIDDVDCLINSGAKTKPQIAQAEVVCKDNAPEIK